MDGPSDRINPVFAFTLRCVCGFLFRVCVILFGVGDVLCTGYGSDEACTIEALHSGTVSSEGDFDVEYSATCSYDFIQIGSRNYCSDDGPEHVAVSGNFDISLNHWDVVVGGGGRWWRWCESWVVAVWLRSAGVSGHFDIILFLGPVLAFSELYRPTRAMRCALLGGHAHWLLIGARNPIS